MSIATTRVEDPHDRSLVLGGQGLLRDFNRAGVLDAADVHAASRICALAGEQEPLVALALALAVRAVRHGSICVDLATVAADSEVPDLPWPEVAAWREAVSGSVLLGEPTVLRLDHGLLYLDRYWREEDQVFADLTSRLAPRPLDEAAAAALEAGLARVFPRQGYDEQRAAARVALTQATTVLTGGPGTGKTTTVAALLALLQEQAEVAGRARLRIALAAPTGKAAARLQQAVEEEGAGLADEADRARVAGLSAQTLNRLLGPRPDTSARFRHHRSNKLPHDVVVVDETSMVSLTMMARLLEALRDDARLVLVGDRHQLTSVEAGAVLADVVEGLQANPGAPAEVAELLTSHRFGASIRALAEAVRVGHADEVVRLLEAGGEHVEFVTDADPAERLRPDLLTHALALRSAALAGDRARALELLDGRRLLCAHREGPFGVRHWNRQVERWVSEETGEGIWSASYPGRPFLITANDYGLRVYNGDTGVLVSDPERGLRAVVATTGEPLSLAPSRLSDVETMHAMTIHKSQGSQADEVVVVLPPPDSRLLTRELFYTALTRAREKVVVVGSPEDVRAAIGRKAQRATGLSRRLAGWSGS